MLPYWLLFALWSVGAVQTERRRADDRRIVFFAAAAVLTALMIGFRFQVGGDWGSYQRIYDSIFFLSLRDALRMTDMGYAAANWIAAQVDMGVVFVNVICAALFTGGLARLAWRQPNPALAMLVAVPYLIIVVAMGYTRQAAAIGLICFAIADMSERHLVRLTLLILVAALLHKTAILMLPLALIPVLRRNLLYGIAGGALFVVSAVLFLRGSSDTMVNNYVQSSYDSQGAAIRTAMNLLAAGLFLLLRKRFGMQKFEQSFWTTCSVMTIVSLGALVVASASSGVDRLSLYLIPLQCVTYARLPYALGRSNRALPSAVMGVLAYSFLVQFVWLNYADNSFYWIPYRTALLQADA